MKFAMYEVQNKLAKVNICIESTAEN